MPALAQRRLAGFRFEAQPPELAEKLPRMDIAVFVGFTSAGPLDLPVVVEDVARFQQIFGDDLPLAWDARHGRTVYAQLGPAVRAFFRNGGRRCWVIRVADPAKAETNFFSVPGLLEWTKPNELRPAFARARSPGSWFDSFQCATAPSVMPILVTEATSPQDFVVRLPPGAEVQDGDLVRLRFAGQDTQYFVLVRTFGPAIASPPNPSARTFRVQAELKACFEEARPEMIGVQPCDVTWVRVPARGETPPMEVKVQGARLVGSLASPLRALSAGQLELLIPTGPTSPLASALSPPPGSLLKVESEGRVLWFRVSSVGRDERGAAAAAESATALVGHGLWNRTPPDPQTAWWPAGTLPLAEKLTFELCVRRGDAEAVRLTELGFTWTNKRSWNALPDDQTLFGPGGLPSKPSPPPDLLHEQLRREAGEHPVAGMRFPLAGTGDPASVFLPVLMQALPDEFLPAEHSEADELTRDGLSVFQSSLFLDSDLVEPSANTLLAAAEFIRYQRQDARTLRGIHAALEIEEATLIAVPDAVHAGWKRALSEDVPPPNQSDWLAHPCWGLSDECDYVSKLVTGERPRYDKFLKCELREIEPPSLYIQQDPDALGTFTLAWNCAESGLTFVLEEATRTDWSDSHEIYRGEKTQRTLYGHRIGNYYYRVRAEAGCDTSNWSNLEIPVTVSRRLGYELLQVEEPTLEEHPDKFDPAVIFDLHRSLLRMSAARGDLFAVLALPEHFRAEDSLNHVWLLKASERDQIVITGETPPFTRGENHVFSYGAVYHPWLITRETDGELLHSPPDGAAVGIIARRSIERGAWLAPANEEFRGVIALNPPLADGRRLDLLLAQINQITQEPGGFLSLNADTLSVEPELRPINVRRLLILLRRAALKRGVQYVFEPNGGTLRRLVQTGFEALLDQLFVRGAFAGATRATSYEVVTDDTINTRQTQELGQFRVDLKVAPSLPMSFVIVRLVQTGDRGVATELI
jgi:hypothetical protein